MIQALAGSAAALGLAWLIVIITGKALDRLQGEGQGCMGTGRTWSPAEQAAWPQDGAGN